MGRTPVLFLFMLFPVLLSFNNCGRSSGDLLGSSSNESFLPVASGAISKGDFEYFNPNPLCEEEKSGPAMVLSLDLSQGSTVLQELGCSDGRRFDVDYGALFTQAHNGHLIYYNNRIFASPFLHQGIDGEVHYKEFCFNTELEMDFTIQYIKQSLPGMTEPLEQTVGLLMMGQGAAIPGLQFNGGLLEVADDGSKYFEALNGAYRIVIDKQGAANIKTAILEKADGNQIFMSCWFYKPQ